MQKAESTVEQVSHYLFCNDKNGFEFLHNEETNELESVVIPGRSWDELSDFFDI